MVHKNEKKKNKQKKREVVNVCLLNNSFNFTVTLQFSKY